MKVYQRVTTLGIRWLRNRQYMRTGGRERGTRRRGGFWSERSTRCANNCLHVAPCFGGSVWRASTGDAAGSWNRVFVRAPWTSLAAPRLAVPRVDGPSVFVLHHRRQSCSSGTHSLQGREALKRAALKLIVQGSASRDTLTEPTHGMGQAMRYRVRRSGQSCDTQERLHLS